MRFDVYMPATSAGHQNGILHGSGIVGTVQGDGRLMIDYEGDVARAAQMVTFADRVHRAASRHASLYPTSARDIVLTAEFAHLATYDYATGVVDLTTGCSTSKTLRICCVSGSKSPERTWNLSCRLGAVRRSSSGLS